MSSRRRRSFSTSQNFVQSGCWQTQDWCLRFDTVPADDDDVNSDDEPSDGSRLFDELRSIALDAGLDRVGACDASILDRARVELHRRKSLGLSDTMQFTYRNPDRSTDPSVTVDDARSIFVGARSYHLVESDDRVDDGPADASEDGVPARIAKYAQVDHYAMLRFGLEAVAHALREAGHKAVVVADENNLVDREVAWKAGLGWFGKNANLLMPGAGSWFVLGSVITNADLGSAGVPIPDGCGQCRRCIDSCPTGAIVDDGVIDARKCLAWLVQKPGIFPHEYRIDLGDRLYGCDDCQDSCPITVRLGVRSSVTHHVRPGSEMSNVDVLGVLEADDASIMERFGRWYIPQRNPVWVRRNALIILGNVAPIPVTCRTAAVLDEYARSSDAYLRAHTLWAAHRLGLDDIVALLGTDSDPIVRAEFAQLDGVPRRAAASGETFGRR